MAEAVGNTRNDEENHHNCALVASSVATCATP